jgi:hypothetical protein
MPPPESGRALYRVVYPLEERPTIAVGLSIFEVIDCSESGICYELSDQAAPAEGASVTGKLRFRSGERLEVTGEVIRASAGIVALALDPPLPFARILAEQRYLRAKGYTLRV